MIAFTDVVSLDYQYCLQLAFSIKDRTFARLRAKLKTFYKAEIGKVEVSAELDVFFGKKYSRDVVTALTFDSNSIRISYQH